MAKPPWRRPPAFSELIEGVNMSRHPAKALILAVAAAVLAACSSGGTSNGSSTQKLSGVTVHVVTFTGPQIADPRQGRPPDLEQLTGRKVQVDTHPLSDPYQKV